MQRTEPVGTSMLVMTRARHVAYLCSWQCTSISVSSPHPLQKCALSFQLCLFHCLSFSILWHGFERFLDVSIHLYVCAFLPFFLTQVFTPFHICASLFFCFLLFLLLIFITVFLYPIFPRTCFIALNFILLRASFDATISLPVSVFVSILAQRQASYNLYTSLLPQNSCYHAYFDHPRMVSS